MEWRDDFANIQRPFSPQLPADSLVSVSQHAFCDKDVRQERLSVRLTLANVCELVEFAVDQIPYISMDKLTYVHRR